METKYTTEQLLTVLRRRYQKLEQAYNELEYYARSLESEQANLQQQLAASKGKLRKWQANQGVRLGRTLSLLSRNMHQNLVATAGLLAGNFKHSIQASLDSPAPGAIVFGKLLVNGWAVPNSPDTMQVEVWLDNIRLGLADYHLERWDVIETQPWQTQLDCGFSAQFDLSLFQLKPGPSNLKIRFDDGQSAPYELYSPLTLAPVDPPEHQKFYQDWIERTRMVGWDFLAQRAAGRQWTYQPAFGLVVTLSDITVPKALSALLDSVLTQTYFNWQVWLTLPPVIPQGLLEVVESYCEQNSRIRFSSEDTFDLNNISFDTSKDGYVAFVGVEGLLSEDALFQVGHYLTLHPETRLVYSDEDYIDAAGQRSQPQFKPDWSPELLYSRPYLGQLTFYQIASVKAAGGFNPQLGPAQGYDMVLRLAEQNDLPHHLSKVIYHSRQPLDLNQPLDQAFSRALQNHFERTNQIVSVEPGALPGNLRYRFQLTKKPSISIIIPTRDQSEVLRRCIDSILERSSYPNYEIVIIDNASHQLETHQYFEEMVIDSPVRRISFDGPFNYSAINNYGASQVKSDLLLFLNNDTQVITPGWLEELAAFAMHPEIGAAGARLLFPDDTLQHAGVIVGLKGVADHVLKGLPAASPGYMGLAKTTKNVSALTAACLMTRRELFEGAGGFDAQNLPVAFNDVDYCLKLRKQGLRLVWTPYAELYHYESISRGLDISIEKENRLHQEITYMFGCWPTQIGHDPYYNPNLSRDRLDYAVTSRFPET